MNKHFLTYLVKVFVQVFLDILYFPLWWYGLGLYKFLKEIGIFLRERWMIIGAGVWLRNLFTPMYGQRDFASRVISFFIRLFQIIFRFALFLFFLILSFLILLLWLLFPVIVVYLIIIRI